MKAMGEESNITELVDSIIKTAMKKSLVETCLLGSLDGIFQIYLTIFVLSSFISPAAVIIFYSEQTTAKQFAYFVY